MIMTWPTSLPRPERTSFQRQRQDARRRRQGEAGPPAYGRRFSSAATMVTLSVLLTRSQRETFDNFYVEDCLDGSRLFRMPDPTTEGWPLKDPTGAQLYDESGAPLLMSGSWLCAWGDQPPRETVLGIEFRKSFNIVVMP